MKLSDGCPMSNDDIQRILSAPITYYDEKNDKEEEQTKSLVESLSSEELELAAQASYAYFLATLSENPPTDEQRLHMATDEARRHLFHTKYDEAEKELKEAVQYRKERRIDLIRTCFLQGVKYDNEKDAKLAESLRDSIESDLGMQSAFVRGLDKEGRPIMILLSRTEVNANDEAFVLSIIYSMERALACTEFLDKDQKIVVVLDFADFTSKLAPAFNSVKAIATILQHRYPERLKKLVVCDAPFWMRTMYGLIKPFLDPETKAKFVVVSGAKKKKDEFDQVVDENQAMPFMLQNGKLTEQVDFKRYLYDVPLHLSYDDPRAAGAVKN